MWGDAEHKMLAHTSLDMQVTIEGLIAVHDTEWSVKYIYTIYNICHLLFFSFNKKKLDDSDGFAASWVS